MLLCCRCWGASSLQGSSQATSALAVQHKVLVRHIDSIFTVDYVQQDTLWASPDVVGAAVLPLLGGIQPAG